MGMMLLTFNICGVDSTEVWNVSETKRVWSWSHKSLRKFPFTVRCQHRGSEGYSCPWCCYFKSPFTLLGFSLSPVTPLFVVCSACHGYLHHQAWIPGNEENFSWLVIQDAKRKMQDLSQAPPANDQIMVAIQRLGFCSTGRVFVIHPNPEQIRTEKRNSWSMILHFAFFSFERGTGRDWMEVNKNESHVFHWETKRSFYSQFGILFGKTFECSLWDLKKKK